jgi:hypothetical protein
MRKENYFSIILAAIIIINVALGLFLMTDLALIITGINIICSFIGLLLIQNKISKDSKILPLVHLKLAQRYLDMLNLSFERRYALNIVLEKPKDEKEKIYLMLLTISGNVLGWPDYKSSRWLGYCQYYMINEGYTTIDDERNYSRPLFHNAYDKLGFRIPKTIKF